MKFLYAAWRLGNLGFEDFEFEGDDPDKFAEALSIYLMDRFQAFFTMFAKPPGRDVMPVGMVFGTIPFPNKQVMWCGDFTWFPWASSRNKLESAVNFLNRMRHEWLVIGFADDEVINFFEHVCRYGVMRRVGKVFDMFEGGPGGVFQTRKPYPRGS